MAVNPPTEKYKGPWKLVSLEQGTMTDIRAHTCAELFFEQPPVFVYTNTFFESEELIRANPDHLMIIPDLHWLSQILKRTSGFEYRDLIKIMNPPIYLAKNPRSDRDDMSLVTLRTIECLVSEYHTDRVIDGQVAEFTMRSIYELHYAKNTQDAARLVGEDKAQYCLTNQSGMNRYGLTPVKQFNYPVTWMGIHFDPTKVDPARGEETRMLDFVKRCIVGVEEYSKLE